MISVPMKSSGALDKNTIASINKRKIQTAQTCQTICSINNSSNSAHNPSGGMASSSASNVISNNTAYGINNSPTNSAPSIANKPMPPLLKPTTKGQKATLEGINNQSRVKVCLGWNVTNPQCDVDVSAFLLNDSGKVIGDDWFVFYGQTKSPDNSMAFYGDNGADREYITIDFSKLNSNVKKIVFVLTINEAFEKRLNFGMLKDAYIRIIDTTSSVEYISFKMTDYYSNVISMMIGEIYLHNGNWKFNAVGNGVAKDLAGLCDLYGVQTI